jgi:hypothetical protein
VFPLFLLLHVSLSSYLSLFFIHLLLSLFHVTQFYTFPFPFVSVTRSFFSPLFLLYVRRFQETRSSSLLHPCTVFSGITSNHKINAETTLRDPYYNCCFRLGHYLSWRNNVVSLKTQIKISLILRNTDYRHLKKVWTCLVRCLFPSKWSSKLNIEQKVIMVVCNV